MIKEHLGESIIFEYEASSAQKRLWYLDQLIDNRHAYSEPFAFEIYGNLNVAALERSITKIIQRHESLRTTFSIKNEKLMQVVSDYDVSFVVKEDLTEIKNKEVYFSERLNEILKEPFDLNKGPLLKVYLFKKEDDHHLLIINMHHIITDGWSMGLFFKELGIEYNNKNYDSSSKLNDPEFQYIDYTYTQNEWINNGRYHKQLDYWKDKLGSTISPINLTNDVTEKSNMNYLGEKIWFDINRELVAEVKKFSKLNGTTLYMTLLAAYKVLLYKYTGQADISVGTPIANRNHSNLKDIIGLFVNTLTIRSDINRDNNFIDVLQHIRSNCIEAYENQDIPFDKVVEAINPSRDYTSSPFYQTMFVFQNLPDFVPDFENLIITPLRIDNGTCKNDITFTINENKDILNCEIEFNTNLYEKSYIIQFSEHFIEIFKNLILNPKEKIQKINFLTPNEIDNMLGLSTSKFNVDECCHELFEKQAKDNPDNIALVYRDDKLTYKQLDEKANKLANYLIGQGIKERDFIGISLDRSLDTVIAILATLKAGAVYVPLDPELPEQRLSYICNDINVVHVITKSNFTNKFNQEKVKFIIVDEVNYVINKEKNSKPKVNIDRNDIAYVIYTSGSTGRPKGVKVTHYNVTRLFSSTEKMFNFNEKDVWTLFHSYAFDFSVWEIWGALFYGGKLIVVPYYTSRTPEQFHELIMTEGVTILNQTPSAFKQLVNYDMDVSQKLPLRFVIFGGEKLDFDFLKTWFDKYPEDETKLVNMYGITETTVHVTYHLIKKNDTLQSKSLIGQPISDLKIYLLDDNLNLVPKGAIGEIFVGGSGVTKGYHNRTELNLERFILNPFNKSEKLYKTGDLAKFVDSSTLEYISRKDNQVKLHGYRIELDEIRTVVNSYELVKDSVIVVTEKGGNKTLTCFYISNKELEIKGLKEYVKEKIPGYMVPAEYVSVNEFPINNNGKLDVNKLMLNKLNIIQNNIDIIKPRNNVEISLCEIFTSVLGCQSISIDDNYFDIGGDSIRSIQVVSRANQEGIKFTIKDLIEQKTIKNLYENVLIHNNNNNNISYVLDDVPNFGLISSSDISLMDKDIEDAYPLTKLQEGMLFHNNFKSNSNIYHNVTLYKINSKFELDKIEIALKKVIEAHPILRISFNFNDFSKPLQLVFKSVDTPLIYNDWTKIAEEEQISIISDWFEAEEKNLFVIDKAPLIRFCVHHTSNHEFYFGITEHHAILDGWSVASLISEIFNRYHSLLNNVEYREYKLKTSFKDYVKFENEVIESQTFKEYWSEVLNLNLQTNVLGFSKAKNEINKKSVITERIPDNILKKLMNLSKTESVPLKSILLAVHVKVMQLLSGSSEVTTGLVTNTRLEAQDGEKVIGLFLNTLPYSIDIRNLSWSELIQKVFTLEKQMFEFRQYPFEQMNRNNNGDLIIDTCFNYTNFHVYESLNQLNGFEINQIKESTNTNFALDIDFSLSSKQHELLLILEWDPNKYTKNHINSIYNYYLIVMKSIFSEINNKHNKELLTTLDKDTLEKWNSNSLKINEQKTISGLLEEIVDKHPNKLALIHNANKITFNELNVKANRLANYLRANGVKKNDVVGILLDKSINTVVSVFAVLKLGGSFLSLDPSYPIERIKYMIKDSELSNIIIDNSTNIDVLNTNVINLFNLDAAKHEINIQPNNNLTIILDKDSLAYIIYTSGSTGNPKGTMITNKNWINTLEGYKKVFELNSSLNHLQMASSSFDVFCGDFIRSLCTGGTLVLFDKNKLLDAEELYKTIIRNKISFAEFVPTVFRNFMDFLESGSLNIPTLQTIILSSDSWYMDEYERYKRILKSNNRLINMYGLTEDTIDCTVYDPEENEDYLQSQNTEIIPIGKPFTNKKIYILDEYLNRVPIGSPGEIYIGGSGVSKGYLNKFDLTAERFIPNPFCNHSSIMYKTGDIGFFLPDGNVCLIGRSDNQVKIRGFRVELREVEKIINQNKNVAESIVLAKKDKKGNDETKLFAYISSISNEKVSLTDIQRELKLRLPYFMVPSEFAVVNTIPILPNGKINRKKLLEYPTKRIVEEIQYNPPKDDTEKRLAEIWRRIFNIKRVGRDDNFFEMGGHSLLALRMSTNIKEEFGVSIPIHQIFEDKTLKNIAGIIKNSSDKLSDLEHIPVVNRRERNSLSPSQERIWFIEQYYEGTTTHNIPLAFKLNGKLNVRYIEDSVKILINRHEALRTTYSEKDGIPFQVVNKKIKDFSIPIHNITEEDRLIDNHFEMLIKNEFEVPFDLVKDIPMRVKLYKKTNDQHLLVFMFHHISFDGWSSDVFVKELSSLYNSFCENKVINLPSIPYQFIDFSKWQNDNLDNTANMKSIAFWEESLANLPNDSSIPLDYKRSIYTNGGIFSFEISGKDLESLKAFSKKSEVSLYMTLLTAFKVLVYHNSKNSDIIVGTPIANRNILGIENTIGCFLNTIVLRTKIEDSLNFMNILDLVRQTVLNAFSNQDIPFEKIVTMLNPKREINKNPIFQLFFVLHSLSEPASLYGLEAEELTIEERESKFDIHFDVEEQQNNLIGNITFNKSLFKEETIKKIIKQYLTILDLFLKDNSISLYDISRRLDEIDEI